MPRSRACAMAEAVVGSIDVEGSVKVLAFAGARDVLGSAELAFPLARPCTAGQLLDEVCRRFPALAPWRSAIRVAVNGAYVHAADPVAIGDEVALIPPGAGG